MENLKVFATDIQWDTDGERVELPNTMLIPQKVLDEVEKYEDADVIGDYLSDETGFCHYRYSLSCNKASKELRERGYSVLADEMEKGGW